MRVEHVLILTFPQQGVDPETKAGGLALYNKYTTRTAHCPVTATLMEIWDKLEQFTPIVLPEPSGEDGRFLNGPKLEGDGGHFSQDDVDAIFGRG